MISVNYHTQSVVNACWYTVLPDRQWSFTRFILSISLGACTSRESIWISYRLPCHSHLIWCCSENAALPIHFQRGLWIFLAAVVFATAGFEKKNPPSDLCGKRSWDRLNVLRRKKWHPPTVYHNCNTVYLELVRLCQVMYVCRDATPANYNGPVTFITWFCGHTIATQPCLLSPHRWVWCEFSLNLKTSGLKGLKFMYETDIHTHTHTSHPPPTYLMVTTASAQSALSIFMALEGTKGRDSDDPDELVFSYW